MQHRILDHFNFIRELCKKIIHLDLIKKMALKEKDLIICQTFKLKTILKLDSQSLKKSKHDEKQDLIKKLQIKMIIKLV